MRYLLLAWIAFHPLVQDQCLDLWANRDDIAKPFVIEIRDDRVVRVPVSWGLFGRLDAHYPWERFIPLPKVPEENES